MEKLNGDDPNKNSAVTEPKKTEGPPLLVDDYERVKQETDKIRELIPAPEMTKEERVINNGKIREILPALSNYSIIRLAIGLRHQLTLKEFKKRFAENAFASLKELFLIRSYVGDGVDFRYGGSLHGTLREKIMRLVPSADQNEIIDIFCYYVNDSMMNKDNILTDVLLERNDAEEIIKKVRERGPKGGSTSDLDQALHFVELDYRRKAEIIDLKK